MEPPCGPARELRSRSSTPAKGSSSDLRACQQAARGDESQPLLSGGTGEQTSRRCASGEHARPPCGTRRQWLGPLAGLVTVAAICLLLRAGHARPAAAVAGAFVAVNGVHLEAHCRPFYVAGMNVENIALAPVARTGRRLLPGEPSGRQKVRLAFKTAAAAGINVIRTWAHSSDPHGEWVLQVRPGEYDEGAFRALDWVVAEAGRAGVRIVLSLVDNWAYRGGVDDIVDWSPSVPPRDPRFPRLLKEGDASPDDHTPEHRAYEARRHALFFSNPSCRAIYRAHATALAGRRNTFTGARYRDDPAIMAWGLINELRCSQADVPACPRLVLAWLREMSDFVRSVAPHQIILSGSDGFWAGGGVGGGLGAGASPLNPGAWAGEVGQDFLSHSALPNISAASIHIWPQQWQVADGDAFGERWLREHAEAAALLGKPLLVEEHGAPLGGGGPPPAAAVRAVRDPAFGRVFAAAEAAFASAQGSALAGSLFWRFAFRVYPTDVPGPHGVEPSSSTWQLVAAHGRRVAALNASQRPRADCAAAGGCWVPRASLGGLVSRCRPASEVCRPQHGRSQPHGTGAGASSSPAAEDAPLTYPTRADCCRPGLGAFRRGCTLPW